MKFYSYNGNDENVIQGIQECENQIRHYQNYHTDEEIVEILKSSFMLENLNISEENNAFSKGYYDAARYYITCFENKD